MLLKLSSGLFLEYMVHKVVHILLEVLLTSSNICSSHSVIATPIYIDIEAISQKGSCSESCMMSYLTTLQRGARRSWNPVNLEASQSKRNV